MADDSQAFIDFNSWAVSTWQAAHTGQIQLTLPASTCLINGNTVVCAFNSNLECPFIGIKNLAVVGQGRSATTLTIASGKLISLGGMGVHQDNAHSARTASANVGDACVTLSTPAQASLFSAGNPARMAGLDTQAIWNGPFGFPDNPSFWDYLTIASVDSTHQCDGTTSGASVHFTSSLTNQYLSTWPLYNSGDASEIDPGGPATLYVLDPSWAADVNLSHLTLNYSGQIYSNSRSITYDDVVFGTSGGCAVPTQNVSWTAKNSDFTTCGVVEVDKVIDNVVTANDTFGQLFYQSGSVKLHQDTGSTFTQLQGSPIAFSGAGTTFSSIAKPGADFFGRSKSFSCTSCSIASFQEGGITDDGGTNGVQNVYTMSGGVISSPNGTTINSVQSSTNPSFPGAAQFVVDSSAGFSTGQYVNVGFNAGNIYNSGPSQQINVDDATHVTLIGSTFSSSATGYLCRGDVKGSYCSIAWAVPGANIMFVAANGIEAICQVASVTQDTNLTHVTLSGGALCTGGWPAGATKIRTHPAPSFTLTGSTGADSQVASLALAPAGNPLYSFQTYTVPGTVGTTAQSTFTMWGMMSQVEINVTSPSTGASLFHLSEFDNWPVYAPSPTTGTYGPLVDAHTSGDRKIDSSGNVTCNGSPGACSASDSLTTPASLYFGVKSFSGPQYATAPNAGASITITVKTDQGVVN